MKIKNLSGRSWISQWDTSGFVIHIKNSEVVSAELKGNQLIIEVREHV